jgi:hypothetical protein
MMTKDNLYGWVFTYNPITGNWRACTREDYLDFFSIPEKNFIRSKDLNTLQEIIMKSLYLEDKL